MEIEAKRSEIMCVWTRDHPLVQQLRQQEQRRDDVERDEDVGDHDASALEHTISSPTSKTMQSIMSYHRRALANMTFAPNFFSSRSRTRL